jgi:hypothetical protein
MSASLILLLIVGPSVLWLAMVLLVLWWGVRNDQPHWPPIGSRIPIPPPLPRRHRPPPHRMVPPAPAPLRAVCRAKPEGPPNRLVRMGLHGGDIT